MFLLNSLSATTELAKQDHALIQQLEHKRDCASLILQYLSFISVSTYSQQLDFQEIVKTHDYCELDSIKRAKKFQFHLTEENLEKTKLIARRCQELFLRLKTQLVTSEEFVEELFKEEAEEASKFNKAKKNRYQAAFIIDYLTNNQDHVSEEDALERINALKKNLCPHLETIFVKLLTPAYIFRYLDNTSKKVFLFSARPDFTDKNKLLFTLSVKEDLLEGEAVYDGGLLFDDLGCLRLTELSMKTSPFLALKDLQKNLVQALAAIFASKTPQSSFLVLPKSLLGKELLQVFYESGFPEGSPYEKTISIPFTRAKEFFESSSLGQKIYDNLFTMPNLIKI